MNSRMAAGGRSLLDMSSEEARAGHCISNREFGSV
jgi:hypothetical protein